MTRREEKCGRQLRRPARDRVVAQNDRADRMTVTVTADDLYPRRAEHFNGKTMHLKITKIRREERSSMFTGPPGPADEC
ncbi:hypothetical protein GCM10018962_98160 [Dactylosporangium matsuzakiense]